MSITYTEEAYCFMLTEYPDLLTAEQAAKILGINRHQVYRMTDRGELFGIKLVGQYKIVQLRLIEYILGQVA